MNDKSLSHNPTLQDLAQRLGISRTTASNAFNRPDQLSEELRERILATARELGYAGPNPMARKLRTGRAGAIGVLFFKPLTYALNDPTALAFLQGVGQVCERVQSSLLILPVMDNQSAAETVQQAAVDGFILICLPDDNPVVGRVLERRLPVVAVDQANIEGVPSVSIDDRGAARAAGRHLLELDHRQLAILALRLHPDGYFGPVDAARRAYSEFRITAQRLWGYEDALREAGLDPYGPPVWECPGNQPEYARRAARALLTGTSGPTAVLAMSDQLAIGLLQAAEELGLKVPEQVSVVGFDDIPLASQIRPTLTTIRQPLVEKGILAAELLLQEGGQGESRWLTTELVMRESSGPVR